MICHKKIAFYLLFYAFSHHAIAQQIYLRGNVLPVFYGFGTITPLKGGIGVDFGKGKYSAMAEWASSTDRHWIGYSYHDSKQIAFYHYVFPKITRKDRLFVGLQVHERSMSSVSGDFGIWYRREYGYGWAMCVGIRKKFVRRFGAEIRFLGGIETSVLKHDYIGEKLYGADRHSYFSGERIYTGCNFCFYYKLR